MVNSQKGWAVIAGLTVVLGVTMGSTFSSLSIFTTSIIEAFHCSFEEVGRASVAFLLTMTLASPVAGWLIDRLGPRWVMTAGALLTTLSYLLAARSANINELIFAMGLAGIGVGVSTYVPAFTLTAHWIAPRSQGLAFGILLASTSAGSMIFTTLLTRVMTDFGWRNGMTVTAVCIAVFCIPLLIWLARFPESSAVQGLAAPEQKLPIWQELRAPRYWLWTAAVTLATVSLLCVYVAFVPYLVSVGYSPVQAAQFYATTSAAGLVGSLAFGALTNRWGAKRVLLMGSVISAAGILLLLAAHNSLYGWGAVALFALAWGSTSNLINVLSPILLVETMGGDRNFASLFGMGGLISGIGSAASPEIVGRLVDSTHTYHSTIILGAALMIILLPAIPWLRASAACDDESNAEMTPVA